MNKQWDKALKNPQDFAKWIIMREGYNGDPVFRKLMKKSNYNFSRYYKLVHKFKDVSIYKLKKQNEMFVFVKKKQFFVGNKKFLIKGINSYDLAYKSEKDINETFKELSKIGINTIRFWAFGDGFNNGFQVKSGIMNEERLKKMDRIIFDAEKYNIRLIPVLVNNWDDYGGKKQYLKWTGNDIKNGDLFFSENNTKKLFKNYIDHIISRKNTMTKRVYSNEPAILSWELMNEPRISSDKQSVLLEWTKEMADYIKQSDKNHLVSIGSEEEVERMNSNENKPIKLCSIDSIDICSVHLYLFHKNKANYENFSQLNQFLKNQVKFSQKENKPILLGEFGVSKKTKPFSEKPLKIAKKITEDVNRLNYNGYLIWNWNSVSDDSFGFSMRGANDGKYNIDNLKEIIDK
ncbi:cellulase family glycosylhydrolase [bacterium]|nr:cellulase family glycosylhydrolase [bacterium]